MAESLVSAILKQLGIITLQEVQVVRGVDEEVEKLTGNLQSIQAVLADAEKRQVEEATVKLWLEKLKDVSYDIDDVLDEWYTAILKKDAEKVCLSSILSSALCLDQVCLRHNIASKIKELNGRLASIANDKNAYNFKSERGTQEPGLLTTSVIDVSKVFGREEDAKNIKNMLLSENSEGATPRVISIIGMAGLGKTTLARLAFNDPQVKSHFHKKIWVSVSRPFDDKRIAKEILESLRGIKTDLDGLDTILEKIRESIFRKKILLVLDDVWNEDSTRWEALKGSLNCGSPKSRILVTTRKEKVAVVMGSGRTDMVFVGLLSEDGCWKLFTHLAFFQRPSEECKSLVVVGWRIVEKCKGLPLAVKTIGGLLRFKTTREQWQSVLDSEMWEIKEVEEEVFLPLLVSYYDLPSVLKQCFSFCAIFPEDYVIEKDELIKLWMAQGFLNERQNKEMEIVGEEYFSELVMRSFFQDFEEDGCNGIVNCKMHDVVLSFARSLTKNECILVKMDLKKTLKVSLLVKTIRHSFLGEEFSNLPIPINNWEKVRTLLSSGRGWYRRPNNLLNSIDKLTCLRILRLRIHSDTLTKRIGKLIHLRYLDLSYNLLLTTLPEAVCDLYNLQTLDISGCPMLRRLPHGIGRLKNLRYLENRATWGVSFIPKGLRRLTGLRTLRQFCVSTKKSAFKIEDLGNLGHLQQASLVICGLQVVEASQVRILNKIGLRELTLTFDADEKTDGRNEAVVLEALNFPLLESLSILHSQGPTLFPSWMASSTTLLKTLVLSDCNGWESLPPLGKLLSLESLKMNGWGK